MAKLSDSAINKRGMLILNWALVAVIILVVAMVITKIFKAAKLASAAAGDLAGGVIIQQKTGVSVARQAFVRQQAESIENAITRLPFTGTVLFWNANAIVDALNNLVTAGEAALISQHFRSYHAESLKVDFVNKMYDRHRLLIKDIILNNIR